MAAEFVTLKEFDARGFQSNRLPSFTIWQAADKLSRINSCDAANLSSEEIGALVRSQVFGVHWQMELGLNKKNQERTVWSIDRPDSSALYIDNPSIADLRLQFEQQTILHDDHEQQQKASSLFLSERKHLRYAISEIGRLSSIADDLTVTAEPLIRAVQQFRDELAELKSSLDAVSTELAKFESLNKLNFQSLIDSISSIHQLECIQLVFLCAECRMRAMYSCH
ncbi:hypothetical protein R1sor_013162 [Riccia sorocarpa]|uniref:Uncharacterized protein n=1 Tax=Riccia sorocarpa TaxID=122646 RepID=A0ABD3H5Q4_9MARC